MKKYILTITLMIAALSQAQVIITEEANPTPASSSVLLEFGSEPKGIILPSVASSPGAVPGTFIVNTTDKAVQYFDGTDWINLTYPDTFIEHGFINDGTADLGEGVIIGADTSTKPGALVLESVTQAMVLPRVANPHLTVLSPIAGTMVYDTASDALAVYDGQEWSYWAAAVDASGILNGVTLLRDRRHWIASVFDTDYLPYAVPTAAASTAIVDADGTAETITVDYQGSITTTGITVQIPVASVVGSGNIGTWMTTFTVPSELTEDGNSRTLELSWAAQPYTTATKYITATIKSIGGDLLVKKLDINAGIGNDYLGLLLGAFQYPYNDDGDLTGYEVRDIPGIPDRMFGLPDNGGAGTENRHNFLYLPVQGEDGRVWLNNNLGAHYSDINHPSFNLVQQATALNDYLAYGSLFQWGRKGDGHELIIWTGSTVTGATPVNGTISGPLTEPLTTPNYITSSSGEWRNPVADATLWDDEAAVNNPCPHGFKVPSRLDMEGLLAKSGDLYTSVEGSVLRFSEQGYRSSLSTFSNVGGIGYYSTSTLDSGTLAWKMLIYPGSWGSQPRATASAVRCIKD